MPDQVTVTGKVGPNLTATSIVITNVTDIRFDTVQSMAYITGTIGNMMPKIHEFDIKASDTITVTKSGNTWTVTIAA